MQTIVVSQVTIYNGIQLPEVSEVVKMKKYANNSCVSVNSFLDKFLDDSEDNVIRECNGFRYIYLRTGTKAHLIVQFNRFVLSTDYRIYRLAVTKGRDFDLLFDTTTVDKYLPFPILKKYAVCSLFWANSLLRCQEKW